MDKLFRVVVLAAVAAWLGGCGGGSSIDSPVGAATPQEAVETFLSAASEAQLAKQTGEFEQARRAYERMAAVFGTKSGSISKSYPEEEVRNRMIVLSACLRPLGFRITSQPDFAARERGETLVTVEMVRGNETLVLPFRVVLANDARWYIEQIQLSTLNFTC